MKRFSATLLLLAIISGCATAQVSSPGASTPTASAAQSAGLDLSKIPLANFAHEDLQSAAAYATANGYPARAAVYTAIDVQLTACEVAIQGALPKLNAPGSVIGAFTAFEIAAEAVGTGIPASVRVNCGAITLPRL